MTSTQDNPFIVAERQRTTLTLSFIKLIVLLSCFSFGMVITALRHLKEMNRRDSNHLGTLKNVFAVKDYCLAAQLKLQM